MREINQAGLDIIKSFEGLPDGDPRTVNLDPYLCPAGVWTIGWGHAIRGADGQLLRGKANKDIAYSLFPGGITVGEAERLLRADLTETCKGVLNGVTAGVNDNRFSAMVSLAFNIGIGNFKKSTLLKKVNARDFAGAAQEFNKWTRSNGVVLAGLVRRREAERKLFETP